MSNPNWDSPAFPNHPPLDPGGGSASGYPFPDAGMTLRAYIATHALPLAWAAEQAHPTASSGPIYGATYKGAAQRAVYMADALIAALADPCAPG